MATRADIDLLNASRAAASRDREISIAAQDSLTRSKGQVTNALQVEGQLRAADFDRKTRLMQLNMSADMAKIQTQFQAAGMQQDAEKLGLMREQFGFSKEQAEKSNYFQEEMLAQGDTKIAMEKKGQQDRADQGWAGLGLQGEAMRIGAEQFNLEYGLRVKGYDTDTMFKEKDMAMRLATSNANLALTRLQTQGATYDLLKKIRSMGPEDMQQSMDVFTQGSALAAEWQGVADKAEGNRILAEGALSTAQTAFGDSMFQLDPEKQQENKIKYNAVGEFSNFLVDNLKGSDDKDNTMMRNTVVDMGKGLVDKVWTKISHLEEQEQKAVTSGLGNSVITRPTGTTSTLIEEAAKETGLETYTKMAINKFGYQKGKSVLRNTFGSKEAGDQTIYDSAVKLDGLIQRKKLYPNDAQIDQEYRAARVDFLRHVSPKSDPNKGVDFNVAASADETAGEQGLTNFATYMMTNQGSTIYSALQAKQASAAETKKIADANRRRESTLFMVDQTLDVIGGMSTPEQMKATVEQWDAQADSSGRYESAASSTEMPSTEFKPILFRNPVSRPASVPEGQSSFQTQGTAKDFMRVEDASAEIGNLESKFAPGSDESKVVKGFGNTWKTYHEPMMTAARENNIPPGVLASFIQVESEGNPKAVSSVGAQGLGQFMPDTWKEVAPAGADPFDPQANIDATAKYLSQLYSKFRDWRLVGAAYNGGQGRLSRRDNDISRMPPESREYVKKLDIFFNSDLGNTDLFKLVPMSVAANSGGGNYVPDPNGY